MLRRWWQILAIALFTIFSTGSLSFPLPPQPCQGVIFCGKIGLKTPSSRLLLIPSLPLDNRPQDGNTVFSSPSPPSQTGKTKAKSITLTGLPLPPQQTHSLPPLLNQWQVNPQAGDYFDQIQPTPAGYLIWSQFPVKVYLDPDVTQCQNRFSEWSEAILAAIAAWDDYFPLQVTQSPENANIIWQCQRPPLQVRRDRDSLHIPIARNAEARYHFYTTPNAPDILQHRIWIQLSPHQSNSDTQATARHELGHGLGIWGHSPLETDVMYDSQTRQNPVISPRDWNTLQRLYQQPSYSASKGQ